MDQPKPSNKPSTKTNIKPSSLSQSPAATPAEEEMDIAEGVHVLSARDRRILDTLPLYGEMFSRSKRGESYLRGYAVYLFTNVEHPGKNIHFILGSPTQSVEIILKAGELHHLPRHVALHVNSLQSRKYDKALIHCEEQHLPPPLSRTPRFSLMEVDA